MGNSESANRLFGPGDKPARISGDWSESLTIGEMLELASRRWWEAVPPDETETGQPPLPNRPPFSVQLELSVDRSEVATFLRNRDGLDAFEPSSVLTLEQWLADIVPEDRTRLHEKLLSLAASAVRSFECQYRIVSADGRQCWVDLCAIAVRHADGSIDRVVGQQSMLPVFDSARPSQVPSPFHDSLCRLPNRWLFDRLLSQAFAAARAGEQSRFAVLFIDLDGFKRINDQYGHLIGDQALVAVAERFANSLRPEDVLARRDGDEFTVLIRDVEDYEAAGTVAQRMLNQLRSPLALGGIELSVTASIGIALDSASHLDTSSLLEAADRAMYRAKAAGGNCSISTARESSHAA